MACRFDRRRGRGFLRGMKLFRLGRIVVMLCVPFGLAAIGCRSPRSPAAASGRASAALVQFHADSNVRNPAANDAFPSVRRVVLRAVDQRTRPDAIVQVTDRVSIPAGERTLLFAAESATGNVTLSELTLELVADEDYVVWPVVTSEGAILAEVKRGPYGETAGRSSPWTPPVDEGRPGITRAH